MRISMGTTSFPHCCSSLNFVRTMFFRYFADTAKDANKVNLPNLKKLIRYDQRDRAIRHAREALTDYLHGTSALPYPYAELISKNSTHLLYETMSRVPYLVHSFRKDFAKFLRYHPINEFEFFFESIGIGYGDVHRLLKPNVHFFTDDCAVLDAACCLAAFGFPWHKLGRLYLEEISIFEEKPDVLRRRLNELVSLGFSKEQIVGICLTIPCLLKVERHGLSGVNDALLNDLKRSFVDFDFGSSIEMSVSGWSEICRKVKVFYDLGVAEGKVRMLIVKSRCILTDFSEDVLIQKVEFFSRLGVCKAEIGSLILSYPEVLSIKLDDRVISVSSLLEHLGMRKEQIRMLEQNYKYVFGRNTMLNLPSILRAMDLHEWFFQRMKSGYHHLFANYDLTSPNDGVDEDYIRNIESVKNGRLHSYALTKLNFFFGVGYGENGLTLKLFGDARGAASDLQARFDFLLSRGVEFSKLCKMIIRSPKILSQSIDSLSKKIDFLEEIGLPLDCMEGFPSYLIYNLEKRIKRRYKFHLWLIEQGLCTKKYTLSSIVASSHNTFLTQLSHIHPTAPQLWLERYGAKNQG